MSKADPASHYSKEPLAAFEVSQPTVSVIVPCRDEEQSIVACLESLLATTYPMDRLEIIVVDGMSEDRTTNLVTGYLARYPNISLIHNEKKTIPAAMNLGIARSSGAVVMKADAHSSYPPEYIPMSVRHLLAYGADMAGGVITVVPRDETVIAKTIALVLSDRFGSGNAYVKIGAGDIRWADAAAFGCWRRDLFDKVGLFDERLVRSSDMEHNIRIRANGGRILLVPHIRVAYYANSDLRSFWRHNFADGLWVTYVWKFGKHAASWRHFAPLALVLVCLSLIAGLLTGSSWVGIAAMMGIVYVVASLAISLWISINLKRLAYVVTLPIVFATRHIAHGIGALYGIILLGIPNFDRPLSH